MSAFTVIVWVAVMPPFEGSGLLLSLSGVAGLVIPELASTGPALNASVKLESFLSNFLGTLPASAMVPSAVNSEVMPPVFG